MTFINIPVIPQDINQWARKAAAGINELAAQNNATIFTWNKGCVTVPTNTTIAGAAEIFFESEFTGNGTLVITVFDAEGGVNVALNGVELGALTGAAGQEVLYEVAVTNLVEGDDPLNVFNIWSTNSDTAELRKLEVYRNFAKEQISDSAIWGNITGIGKPEDDAQTNRPTFGLAAGLDDVGGSSSNETAIIAYDTNGAALHDATAQIAVDDSVITIRSGEAGETVLATASLDDGTYYVVYDVTQVARFTHEAAVDRDAAVARFSAGLWQYWQDKTVTDDWTTFTEDVNFILIGEVVYGASAFTAASGYGQGIRLGSAPELSSTNNAAALLGQLILDGATIEQSSGGAVRVLTEGMATGVAFDGDTFVFDPARDAVPTIVWGAGGKTESSALTPPTWKDFQAQSLTTGGFTAFLKISEIEGSLTSRIETGATTGGTFDFEMNKDETADEAFDDNYTLQIDVSVNAAVGGAETNPSTVTVAYLANNGAGFVEKATKTFTNFNTGSAKTFLNNLQTINIDGMGLNDDWAVNVKSTGGNGGSITAFDNVTYESGSAGASTESATPTGVSGINFEIKSGEEGSVT